MVLDPTPVHGPERERRLAETFVVLADTLVADFDPDLAFGRLAQACVEVLGAAAAGVALADARGGLVRVAGRVAGSSDAPRPDGRAPERDVPDAQDDDGPTVECHRTGEPVAETALDAAAHRRWPVFAPLAVAAGYRSVQALPLRLREQVIGALDLYGDDTRGVVPGDVRIAQALADVMTIALLQQRAVDEGETLAQQLQTALTTRVVVEQAKGLLAERGGLDVEEAFVLLRRWCRDHRTKVGDTARALIERRQDADEVLAAHRAEPPEGP